MSPNGSFVLDHVFVAASPGGLETRMLSAAGLREGPAHHHPGQGTADLSRFELIEPTIQWAR